LLQGMILNLEQELSSSKKLSQELEVHTILWRKWWNLLRKEGNMPMTLIRV
jgi:hypothetical protein